MPEYDCFSNVRARTQNAFNRRWRNRLAARSNQEIACAIDQAQVAILPFPDIAGMHPVLRINDLPRRLWPVPIAFKLVRSEHQDFAARIELDLPTACYDAHIARLCKWLGLAANERAARFGLPVRFDQINSPYLPQRGGFLRQRCGAGYRQFDLVDLYPEPAGYAVFAGYQGQTAAGVTGRPFRVRWGRGLAAGRFSGT